MRLAGWLAGWGAGWLAGGGPERPREAQRGGAWIERAQRGSPQTDLQPGRLSTDFYVEPQRTPPRTTYVHTTTYIHMYIRTHIHNVMFSSGCRASHRCCQPAQCMRQKRKRSSVLGDCTSFAGLHRFCRVVYLQLPPLPVALHTYLCTRKQGDL